MIVEMLFPLLGTPHPDAIFYEPFHHKRRLVRDPPDAVKHEHQQDVKLALLGAFFYKLELVTVFGPYLMSGNAVLLLLVNNRPALFLRKTVAGFSLHQEVCLTFIIVIHLFIGGYSV